MMETAKELPSPPWELVLCGLCKEYVFRKDLVYFQGFPAAGRILVLSEASEAKDKTFRPGEILVYYEACAPCERGLERIA